MDPDTVGVPMLRKKIVNMNVGAQEQLVYDFDPWYTSHRDVVWTSSDESVVSVTQDGTITALARGEAIVTVANADDPNCFDTISVTVTELTLEMEGVISSMGAGVGNTGGTCLYKYHMENSVPNIIMGKPVFAPRDLNFGLSIATSV